MSMSPETVYTDGTSTTENEYLNGLGPNGPLMVLSVLHIQMAAC